ncbi:hypothetical protein D3C75_831180 [compost metagenome]
MALVEGHRLPIELFQQQLLDRRMVGHLLHQAVNLADQRIQPAVGLNCSLLDVPLGIIFKQRRNPVIHERTRNCDNNQHNTQKSQEYLITQCIHFSKSTEHLSLPLTDSVSNSILQKSA